MSTLNRSDSKHAVKDESKPYVCPYGSCTTKFGKPGKKNFGSHKMCRGKLLPAHLVIDLAAKPPLLGKLRLDEPTYKDMRFDDPEYVGWINTDKVVLPVKEKKSSKKPFKFAKKTSAELDYSKVVYWIDELSVRVGDVQQDFEDWDQLLTFLLEGEGLKVVHQGLAWVERLTKKLDERDVKPEVFLHKERILSYKVKSYFSLYNIDNYGISSLDEFEKCHRFIFKLTSMNLLDKLTAAQLAYEEWWKTEGSKSNINILTNGDERNKATWAYYGARIQAQETNLRSGEADEIEDGTYSYEELLEEGAVPDVMIQLDINSMYPSMMTSGSGSYYPTGPARTSDKGAVEFSNNTCGVYHVEYTRPSGLKMAILPKYDKAGKLAWITEAGTDSGWYTNVDLKLAVEYGYRLDFKGPCLCWDTTGHPFDNYVDKLVKLRQEEEDPVLRALIKQFLVCLYGKMGQKETGTIKERKRITEEESWNMIMEGRGEEFVQQGDVYYLIEKGEKESKVPTKPNHLGVFILSWSRVRMAELYKIVDYKCLATRTDSMLVGYAEYLKLREAGELDGKELGKLKLEYGVIYETNQFHATKYRHKYLDENGECQVLDKGKQ